MIKKNPKADLRSSHSILVLFSICCSLLFFIAAAKMNIESNHIVTTPKPPVSDPEPFVETPNTNEVKKPVIVIPSVFNPIPEDVIMEEPELKFYEFDPGEEIKLREKIDEPNTDDGILESHQLQFLPKMKGGIHSLYNEINYPDLAKRIGTEGRVYVQFIVNEKGEVENPTIIRGIGAGCDEEVLRAIKLVSFTPGIQNGKFVKVRMQQPVVFKLK